MIVRPIMISILNRHSELPGFDTGFTFSDYANRLADGNDNWVYNELSTPFRLSHYQDARLNTQGACAGGGTGTIMGLSLRMGRYST